MEELRMGSLSAQADPTHAVLCAYLVVGHSQIDHGVANNAPFDLMKK
jgi:hypothetical protein